VLGALVDAFRRFGEEAQIVGRLLTGYTAIEYQLCMCAGMGGGDVERAVSDLYSKRGETRRVKIADGLGGAGYAAAGLGATFDEAIEDMILCLTIRNQYAHCIWHDDRSGRLVFAHMEEIAAPTGPGADPITTDVEVKEVGSLRFRDLTAGTQRCCPVERGGDARG
jgi:hypothetical protein